ncbi:MAG: RdgB/HAM1 family non-canonical purine NTP pyrophosphatase [Actinomycetota bacterium]
MASLVVASSNPGKIAELVDLLGDRYSVLPRPTDLPDTVEDGETLEANATKKAAEVSAFTGSTALADDTGLFVDALEGRPGVRTARFAGPDATNEQNVAKMLAELAGVENRRARFRTVIALTDPSGTTRLASGAVEGIITTEPRGSDGFGYDPIFVPDDGDGRTFAEMDLADKQHVSHRARALQALLQQLRQPGG